MKYVISTLGCKVNQYESRQMEDMLISHGCTPAQKGEQADICIVNTCSVTSTADRKSRQSAGRLRREHPDAVVCVCGCVPQGVPEKAERLAGDVIIGNSNRDKLFDYVMEFFSKREKIVRVEPHSKQFKGEVVASSGERTRAYMKIEDGCNRFCSYCIIPYARGRVRSRPLEEVRREAIALSEHYKEVVLVGINLTAYGLGEQFDLADAVAAASEPEGIERVRLGSLEPDYITDGLLDKLSKCEKLCPQFHMSLQSGCTETLKRMNRHYSADEYAEICAKLRKRFPNCAITTDIMVGFPQESDEEFEKSLAFAKKTGFARIHCFIYSRRSGTAADKMDGQIDPRVASARSARMLECARMSAEAFHWSQIGIKAKILIERETEPGVFEGVSENYTPYRVKGHCSRGEIAEVMTVGADEEKCEGEII